jgi:hypothetical protein
MPEYLSNGLYICNNCGKAKTDKRMHTTTLCKLCQIQRRDRENPDHEGEVRNCQKDEELMLCYGKVSGECSTTMCDRAHPHKRNERCVYPCEDIEKYHCVPNPDGGGGVASEKEDECQRSK